MGASTVCWPLCVGSCLKTRISPSYTALTTGETACRRVCCRSHCCFRHMTGRATLRPSRERTSTYDGRWRWVSKWKTGRSPRVRFTNIAVADEIAASAELVQREVGRRPGRDTARLPLRPWRRRRYGDGAGPRIRPVPLGKRTPSGVAVDRDGPWSVSSESTLVPFPFEHVRQVNLLVTAPNTHPSFPRRRESRGEAAEILSKSSGTGTRRARPAGSRGTRVPGCAGPSVARG